MTKELTINNEDLQKKVLELLEEENYFDFIIKAKVFEPEYKQSDFYKTTKMPLKQMIREAKIFYAVQFRDLGKAIQRTLDGLNFGNFNTVLDKLGDMFSQENGDIMDNMSQFKDLLDELNGKKKDDDDDDHHLS